MFSETRHTPGPWSTAEWPSREKDYIRVFAGTTYVGSVGNSDDPFERTEANARLIAAAPDLLAALKLILQSIPSEMFGDYESDAAYAAIAKAEGEGE